MVCFLAKPVEEDMADEQLALFRRCKKSVEL